MTLPASIKHPSFAGRVGIAHADITPAVGIYSRNWGAAKQDTADSIHRPLTLNVLTVATAADQPPLVLVDADLGWWRSLEFFRQFQQRLLGELSLDSSRLLFALTHTHSAVPLMQPDPELPGSELLGPWLDHVCVTTVATVKKALANTFPATVDWHFGRCSLAANRDFPDPGENQPRRLICGFNPANRADDTLLLGRISDQSGALRGTIVNYACHPTTLAWQNTAISPDFVGAMRATIQSSVGGGVFFLQGMSGDLAPRHQYLGDTAVADRHGTQLAHAALATLFDMRPPATELAFAETVESGAPLAVWRHRPRKHSTALAAVETTVQVPIKDWPSAAELEQQRSQCRDRTLQERLRRQRDIRRALGDGVSYPHPIHVWRIGDAILTCSCSEAYSHLQQDLRRRFPGVALACANLVNGSIGYLPTEPLYDEDVYPVWQTPFDRGSLERVGETMAAVIEDLLANCNEPSEAL